MRITANRVAWRGVMIKQQSYPSGYLAGDRYQVIEIIGAGAMGEVYRAFDTKVEKQVALKFLTLQSAHNPDLRKRFEREAKAAGRIGHDNVCDITDWGVTDEGAPFLVMELLQGESLTERLQRERRIPVEEGVSMMCGILAALEAAHAQKIVHRDLKPANIFLHRASDSSERVKLVDFGIAKFLDSTGTGTKEGTVLGTLFYMSPEQARGDAAGLDHRTDIWAAGVILYQMLAGLHPFQRRCVGEVIAAILGYEPPELAEIEPPVPPQVSAAVARALRKNPDERFSSAAEFSAALREELSSQNELEPATIPGLPITEFSPTPPLPPSDISGSMTQPLAATTLSDTTVPPTVTASLGNRSVFKWIAMGILGIDLLIAGGLAVYSMSTDTSEPTVTTTTSVETNQPRPPTEPLPTEPRPPTEPLPVEILLRGLPEGAQAVFDGRPVADQRIRGSRGSAGLLTVTAPDYERLNLPLTLDSSRELDLSDLLLHTLALLEPDASTSQPEPPRPLTKRPPLRPRGERMVKGRQGTSVVLDYPEE